jgi:acyl-CoA thioesterase FadM
MEETLLVSEAQERVVATGETGVVVYDYSVGRKTAIPELWLKAIALHE